jgi:hypothetical protein
MKFLEIFKESEIEKRFGKYIKRSIEKIIDKHFIAKVFYKHPKFILCGGDKYEKIKINTTENIKVGDYLALMKGVIKYSDKGYFCKTFEIESSFLGYLFYVLKDELRSTIRTEKYDINQIYSVRENLMEIWSLLKQELNIPDENNDMNIEVETDYAFHFKDGVVKIFRNQKVWFLNQSYIMESNLIYETHYEVVSEEYIDDDSGGLWKEKTYDNYFISLSQIVKFWYNEKEYEFRIFPNSYQGYEILRSNLVDLYY